MDGALALLLIYPGAGIPKLGIVRLLVTLPFVLGMAVPVVFRRAYPVAAFAAVIAVGALQVLLLRRPAGADLAVLIVLYTLAASRPRRISLRGLAICLAGAAVAIVRWHPARPADGFYTIGAEAALFGGPVLLAWLLGDSDALAARLLPGAGGAGRPAGAGAGRAGPGRRGGGAGQDRARDPRRGRAQRQRHGGAGGRGRVRARRLAAAGPGGAGRDLGDRPAGAGRDAVAARRAARSGRSGRSAGAGPALAPQPGIEELGDLLEQARTAGLPVSLTVAGVPRPVPAGEALAVYRIVQESLTNTRKHGGPGATAAVSLGYGEDGLLIRVTDDGPGPRRSAGSPDGAGHGLAGMRERVELYGGMVRSGPRPGGGYEVVARLPVAREAAA